MKRTSSINLSRMRKCIAPTVLAVAVSAALFGCGSNQTTVSTYKTVEDCVRSHPGQQTLCENNYQQALAEAERTAPKYRTLAECQAEFGTNMCRSSSSSSGIFMPMMAGYMIGQMLSPGRGYVSTPLFTSRSRYSPMYGGFYGSQGQHYGRATSGTMSVSQSALAPKPTTTRTMSRGGFGSQAVAKSAWSGSRSSRSGFGWGG